MSEEQPRDERRKGERRSDGYDRRGPERTHTETKTRRQLKDRRKSD